MKVLDFGLAKALAGGVQGPDLSQAPTVTATVGGTRGGVILGTAAYMSPEQARGRTLDARTDIWSFGCVLYEALTGRAAFLGETLSDTLARILERDPDWSALPLATPPTLKTLLRRCLQKRTTRRLHHIADARLEFEDGVGEDSRKGTIQRAPVRRGKPLSALVPWTVAALLAAVVGLLWMRGATQVPARVVRTTVPFPSGQVIVQSGLPLAMAPDGRRLAYTAREAGTTRLYLRDLDDPNVRLVPETGGASYPFFSPDGEWVGYWAAGSLYRVPAAGGPPLPIGDAPEPIFGAAWGPDGTLVYATGSGLYRVPVAGGDITPIGGMDDLAQGRWPQFLPNGGLLAVRDDRSIVRLDLSSTEVQTLWEPAEPIKQARYLP